MNQRHVAGLGIVVCGFCGWAWAGQEFLVAGGGGEQSRPAISGTIVVWQEKSQYSGDWNVKGADLRSPSSPSLFTVANDDLGDERNPAIWGRTVVFEYESALLDQDLIMMADITRLDQPEVFVIADTSQGTNNYPVVCGDLIAWQDYVGGDWDIRAIQRKGSGGAGIRLPMSWDDEGFAAIDGTLLLWERRSQGSNFIVGCDALDPNATAIPLFSQDVNQWYPAISGRWAVCATDRQIEADNLADPYISIPISEPLADAMTRPAICQNVVVWAQKQGGQWHIVGYNLAKKARFQVTSHAGDQIQPAVSFSPDLKAYLVVWADNRNGNWDIYGRVLDSADQVGGCATPLKGDVNEDCIVDAFDVAEVQSRLGQVNGVPAN